jgi:hypothetical protein
VLYGSLEYAYAKPFADALVNDLAFRSWVLKQTKFAAFAEEARLLHDEMRARRSKKSATWWRSHFSEKCRCLGCSGQETDILAIFEVSTGNRFALHIEVKQPTDKFPNNKDQAENYLLRAKCWVASAPRAVLPHVDAATVLLCSFSKLQEYGDQPTRFNTVITFESIAASFPNATLV